jgi:hypothetical protein
MAKPIIRIHNSQTGEVIDREMTDLEFAQAKADQEAYAERQAQAEAKAQAKTALLERLGMTEDEAKLLLS